MLSCDPELMRAYKRVIDEGFAAAYGEGRRIESRASREHVGTLSPEKIAARRLQVQERGRVQSG
jgi:enoyl-CoA hydratase